MSSVLVAGASGQLGRLVVGELKARGLRVRATGRSLERLRECGADELAAVDVTNPGSASNLCEGMESVISCAGASMTMGNFGDRKSFYDVDHLGNRALLDGARRAGVRKFVYVSLANGPNLRQAEYADAHERFGEDLRASGLAHTIVRPTGFFGFHLEILKYAKQGRGVVIGDGSCRTNPIHEADVARACVEALATSAGEMPIGGPEIFTRKQTVEMAFAALGRPPKLMRVSPGLFRAMVRPLRLVNRRLHALMEFGIAVTQTDVVAPAYGERRLGDYFAEAARRLS